MTPKTPFLVITVISVMLFTLNPTFAATLYSRTSGAWNSNTTWSTSACGGASCGCTPGNGDIVIICNGFTVTSASDIIIGPGGSASSITVNNGGALSLGSNLLEVKSGGLLASSGVITVGSLQFDNGSIVTINASGSINDNGSFTNKNNSNGVAVNGIITVNADLSAGNKSTVTGSGEVIVKGTSSGAGTVFGISPGCSSCTFPTSLPITLLDFTAYEENKIVTLAWETMTEHNNKEFTVLRSTDGLVYSPIATVKGGNSITEHFYSVTDTFPKSGINYYTLKQTDYDGHSTFSKIITVNNTGYTTFSLSPNPAFTYLRLKYTAITNGALNIKIMDLTGKIVLTNTFSYQNGLNTFNINVGAMISGTYLLIVSDGVTCTVKRFEKSCK